MSHSHTVYANVIIDISHEKVDRVFQYRVPESEKKKIQAGVQVEIPFGRGNTLRKGYVVGLTSSPDYDPEKIKSIAGICSASVTVESRLIQLAWWMRERYGGTMNQALKTVLPVRQKVKKQERRRIIPLVSREVLREEYRVSLNRHYKARARLLEALLTVESLPYELAVSQLNLTRAAMEPLEARGLICIESRMVSRGALSDTDAAKGGGANRENRQPAVLLNKEQSQAVKRFIQDYDQGIRGRYLVYGITGSGKTEVYMEMIRHVVNQGRQVIVLIPEIALTYQTVLRFYRRFGDIVSVVNSRLSAGERYDQFERARQGEVQIMIGPRSALFTPFTDLGLVVIDEEHEGAYKSEGSPRYHAREVAGKLADMHGACLVLGSATPSLEAYTMAREGMYHLLSLTRRARPDSRLSQTEIVDLRQELKEGNKSIFSRRLRKLMEERLEEGQQIMLFMNRRGYSNFVSCRSCGEALSCGHCDVSMTLHRSGELVCHYCGSRRPLPKLCPACGSPYIAPFGAGTQKLEELTCQEFPQARVLRMDLDTTSKKGGHEEILRSFAQGEADILIGTQMIVKGHDFPNVTLMGIMAADQSLFTPDYRCAERTFQLLTQAAGRAGRDDRPGQVVIQTYNPEHYSIQAAACQDYESFYCQEMSFRRVLRYPPACVLLTIQLSCKDEAMLDEGCVQVCGVLEGLSWSAQLELIGPVQAPVYKVNDIYRKILYIKNTNYDILISTKNKLEQSVKAQPLWDLVHIQYDFS